MYAIIEDSGTQIMVKQGDVVRVAKRQLPPDAATLRFEKVLAIGGVEGQAARIGTPLLDGVSVTADVLGEEKTERTMSIRFRRRKNITKRKGHRQPYLKVKITAIQA